MQLRQEHVSMIPLNGIPGEGAAHVGKCTFMRAGCPTCGPVSTIQSIVSIQLTATFDKAVLDYYVSL